MARVWSRCTRCRKPFPKSFRERLRRRLPKSGRKMTRDHVIIMVIGIAIGFVLIIYISETYLPGML